MIVLDIKPFETDMKKAVEHLILEFNNIRSGRVSAGLLDNIEVEQYGSRVPLKHVASMGVLDNNSLQIDLFDKSLVSKVKQAILEKLQIQAVDMGSGLKVVVPSLTDERRAQYVKQAKAEAEKQITVIRNIRQNALDELKRYKKENTLSEDDERATKEKLDDIAKTYTEQAKQALAKKETSILS